MNMNQKILFLFTRTPLHIGAGSSVGAIDAPIQRERHTGFPIIPGSSLKGVLRDRFRQLDKLSNEKVENTLFGSQEEAGRLSLGEGRLLAFPVRSAKGAFAFCTCPLALKRFKRDGGPIKSNIPDLEKNQACFSGNKIRMEDKKAIFEEYLFEVEQDFPADLEKDLLALFPDEVWQNGKGRFALLTDGDFAHFVMNACEVNQHVGINPETGTARPGALFNEECVPSETLFYSIIDQTARLGQEWKCFDADLKQKPLLQLGGDNTTGLGFCTASLAEGCI
ncbi:MAG: type III-B CRISPR module RAMP protein Cmr4 [Lentisphaerota bacterium]